LLHFGCVGIKLLLNIKLKVEDEIEKGVALVCLILFLGGKKTNPYVSIREK
jgi:hypothetical protein